MRFYYDNKFDNVESAKLIVSSEEAAYPKSKLQHILRTEIWRSTGLTSQYVKWEFNEEENCQYIGLVNHNLTADGTFTITASNNADFSDPVLVATFDAWNPIWGFGDGGFGEHGFGGYIPNDERDELATDPIRIYHLGEVVIAKYWKIEPTDAVNSDGYFELGRIFNGMYWEPARGIEWNYVFIPLDETEDSFSEGGQKFSDIKPKRYEVEFTLKKVSDEEKYWRLIDMLRRWGKRKSILMSLFPDGTSSEQFFMTLYGSFRKIPGVGQKFVDWSKASMVFTEDL